MASQVWDTFGQICRSRATLSLVKSKRTPTHDDLAAFISVAKQAQRARVRRYKSLLLGIERDLALGPKAFVSLWRAVGVVLDEKLYRFDHKTTTAWLATIVRTSRSRAYARVKLARYIEQDLFDRCSESVALAALALVEARKGPLAPDAKIDLARVTVNRERRPLESLTVTELQQELDRVANRDDREPAVVSELRARVTASVAGALVRSRGGRVTISGIAATQLEALRDAIDRALEDAR
jgi:hypothetical protein